MRGAGNPYHVVTACFLGWTIDAFDFFIMVFVVGDIARTFGTSIPSLTWAFALTLALRPLGALVFGWLADRFGRRPVLIANILVFSALEVASGFAPSLTVFLALRALYGFAMGGEWGVGASLTMESIPQHWRGMVSGILQSGYSFGYLLAALVYGLGFEVLGWRGMFMVAVVPALLVLYIRSAVPESPAWQQGREAAARGSGAARDGLIRSLRQHPGLYVYAIILMTAAATFSHGTQDLYPVFLREQHHLSVHEVSILAVVFNIGAILGCLTGGTVSQVIGRRRALVLAPILALVLLPFWAGASGMIGLGLTAALMQYLVQCMFGVIPAHLNEVSPPEVRATFPGFTYQFGNALAAGNATIQAMLAVQLGGNYGWGLGVVVAVGAVAFSLLAFFGGEAKDTSMAIAPEPPVPIDLKRQRQG